MNFPPIKRRIAHGLSLMLCVIIGSAIALMLFFYNNQYTYDDIQAVDGVWPGTQTDLTQEIHFLSEGWLYYDDILLTPETVPSAEDTTYTVVNMAEYSTLSFDALDYSFQGMSSYVMTLELPQTSALYALTIPVVYSAYNLYIGDTLYTTMGDPSPDTYTSSAQVQTIVFQASGTTQLILAVHNKNFYYGGLTSAPVLGSPTQVTHITYVSLIASSVLTALALLLCAVGTWISLSRSSDLAHPILIFLFFLCAAFMLVNPTIEVLLSLPKLHWYRFIYINSWLLTLLIILLHNIICKPPPLLAWFSTGFTLLIGIACAFLMCFPTLLPNRGYYLNGFLRFSVYFIIALCLLATSYHGLRQRPTALSPLFYSDVIYAILLFWRAALTAFQPIIGWDFKEIGELIVVFTLGSSLLQEILARHRERQSLKEAHRQMAHQLYLQQTHFDAVSQQIAESRRQRHDFRHHLHTISNLTDQPEALRTYISEIVDISDQTTPVLYCQSPALNALLFHYATITKKASIPLRIKVELPPLVTLPTVSYCVILGNLLENAFTACQMPTTKEPYIDLHIKWQYEKIYTLVDNRFDGVVHRKMGVIFSRKHTGPGQGLPSVTAMAEKLNGSAEFQITENRFRSIVVLPQQSDS